MVVEELTDPSESDVADLAAVLVDCVEGGASVSFMNGLSINEAAEWWWRVLADGALTFVARDEAEHIVGVVRLIPAWAPNSQHRADVSKLLVAPSSRGAGVAAALMRALEVRARELGRTLLVLDTETGSPAESIYAGWGWERIGEIADFALTPDGRLASTTVFVKRLT